jgi:hypothetical protein
MIVHFTFLKGRRVSLFEPVSPGGIFRNQSSCMLVVLLPISELHTLFTTTDYIYMLSGHWLEARNSTRKLKYI